MTDEDRYAKFTADEPGSYLIKGGDAENTVSDNTSIYLAIALVAVTVILIFKNGKRK